MSRKDKIWWIIFGVLVMILLLLRLCDISREEFTVQQAIAEKAVFRADIGGGASYGYTDEFDGGPGLALYMSLNHEYFQVLA